MLEVEIWSAIPHNLSDYGGFPLSDMLLNFIRWHNDGFTFSVDPLKNLRESWRGFRCESGFYNTSPGCFCTNLVPHAYRWRKAGNICTFYLFQACIERKFCVWDTPTTCFRGRSRHKALLLVESDRSAREKEKEKRWGRNGEEKEEDVRKSGGLRWWDGWISNVVVAKMRNLREKVFYLSTAFLED